jgi:predicted lysophospholipase L1 biosynthesis ABC-type transport system permease subunit
MRLAAPATLREAWRAWRSGAGATEFAEVLALSVACEEGDVFWCEGWQSALD